MFLLLQFKFSLCRTTRSATLYITCKDCKFFKRQKQAFIIVISVLNTIGTHINLKQQKKLMLLFVALKKKGDLSEVL